MIWLLVVLPVLSIQDSSAWRLSDYYNRGVSHYNQSQYGPAAGYFYYVWLRNPYDPEVTGALKSSLTKLDKPLNEDHRIYLNPVKNLLLWFHLIFLGMTVMVLSIYFLKSRRSLLIISGILMLFSFFTLFEYWQVSKYNKVWKAMVTGVDFIHQQPVQGARTDIQIDAGTVVRVKEIRGNWVKVEISNQQGWMVGSNLMLL